MLNNVMSSEVDETNVCFVACLYKPLTQVVDSWKTLIVVDFGKVRIIENGPSVIRVSLFPILHVQT